MTTVRFFHRTSDAAAILANGFRDATGNYLTANEHTGVWLSDVPLDENEGAQGDDLLAVDVPADVAASWADYEWLEDGKPYREWLVPAAEVNGPATVELLDPDEVPSRFNLYR